MCVQSARVRQGGGKYMSKNWSRPALGPTWSPKQCTVMTFLQDKTTGAWGWPPTSHLVLRRRTHGATHPLPQVFIVYCLIQYWHTITIQINHQPDATIFQFIILTFIYSSTCFGRFPAHHQELKDCSDRLWFYLRIVVTVVHSTTVTTIRR